jgi:hypothetical protein
VGWQSFRFFGDRWAASSVSGLEQESFRRFREAGTGDGGRAELWIMTILAIEMGDGKRQGLLLYGLEACRS